VPAGQVAQLSVQLQIASAGAVFLPPRRMIWGTAQRTRANWVERTIPDAFKVAKRVVARPTRDKSWCSHSPVQQLRLLW